MIAPRLTPIEQTLLQALVNGVGVVPYTDLLTAAWGSPEAMSVEVLRVHICRLRQRLMRAGQFAIHNHRDQGYSLGMKERHSS